MGPYKSAQIAALPFLLRCAAIEEKRAIPLLLRLFYCGALGAIEDGAPQLERFYTVPTFKTEMISEQKSFWMQLRWQLGQPHANWIRVGITIYQYIGKKQICNGI